MRLRVPGIVVLIYQPQRDHFGCAVRSGEAKVKRSDTDRPSCLAKDSRFSKDGAFMPRSIRLKKSTDMSSSSANCSWLIPREERSVFSRWPNFSRKLDT